MKDYITKRNGMFWRSSLLAMALLVVASSPGQTLAPKPRGIFVYSESLPQDSQPVLNALSVPGVDGLTLVFDWKQLEPNHYDFQFAELNQWMAVAAENGKQVTLAVRAAQGTPCWLFVWPACGPDSLRSIYALATPYTFQVSARGGNAGLKCNLIPMAAPWDPVFQREWDRLLAAIADDLKENGLYGTLTALRLTGINRSTPELRLPAEILTKDQCPQNSNAIAGWVAAGYRPARLLAAWDQLTGSFRANFPDKYFSIDIIPADPTGQGLEPFPAIDERQCVYTPPYPLPGDPTYVPVKCSISNDTTAGLIPDMNAPLLQMASNRFGPNLSVAFENLDLRANAANPYPVFAAQTWGTGIGYQTNDYDNLHHAACSGNFITPGPCDAQTYLQLLEQGIYPLGKANPLRALYIEVLPPDAVAFPSAIMSAHNELFQ